MVEERDIAGVIEQLLEPEYRSKLIAYLEDKVLQLEMERDKYKDLLTGLTSGNDAETSEIRLYLAMIVVRGILKGYINNPISLSKNTDLMLDDDKIRFGGEISTKDNSRYMVEMPYGNKYDPTMIKVRLTSTSPTKPYDFDMEGLSQVELITDVNALEPIFQSLSKAIDNHIEDIRAELNSNNKISSRIVQSVTTLASETRDDER
jgi:hypothetical protein